MSPGDFFRGRIDSIRSHPFQNLASTVAGGLIPGGGLAANALFGRYNDSRFNNSAQQFQDLTRDQSNLDTNDAMNKPLSGPLGEYDRNNPYGESTTGSTSDRASQDRQLGEALTGGGGGQNSGGAMNGVGYQPPGGWSQQTMSGWNPNQAQANQSFGLLDFLGQNPNQPFNLPTTPSANGGAMHSSPQARRDGYGGGGNPALYGVSNFMVGGSPVINGVNPGLGGDMNGLAMFNPRRYGG